MSAMAHEATCISPSGVEGVGIRTPRRVKSLVAWGLAVFGILVYASVVAGQEEENPSILRILTPEGTIRIGQPEPGTLDKADPLVRAGRRVEAWNLDTEEAQGYQIDLTSDAFDPYLYVVGPGITDLEAEEYALTDDDGGDGLNASLCFPAPSRGTYTVVASALYGDIGPYELLVREVDCSPPSTSTARSEEDQALTSTPSPPEDSFDLWGAEPVGNLELGAVRRGTFTADTDTDQEGLPVDVWTLEVEEGQRLVIDMIAPDLDAYLTVRSPADWGTTDDDGRGTGLDSRICMLVSENETYRVAASNVEGGYGSYGLVANLDSANTLCDGFTTSARNFSDLVMRLSQQAGSDSIPTVEVGDFLSGHLTAADWKDPVFDSETLRWWMSGTAGDSVLLELRSFDFDPDLLVVGPGLNYGVVRAYDDNGCAAHLELQFPETADYLVLVGEDNSGGNQYGSFTFAVKSGDRAERSNETICLAGLPVRSDRQLSVGNEIEGRLTEDDIVIQDVGRVQAWSLDAIAGEPLAIRVESDFYLDLEVSVYGDGEVGEVAVEALSNGVFFMTPFSGTYRVFIVSDNENTGPFTVAVLRRKVSP